MKALRIIRYVFTLVGLVLLIGAAVSWNSTRQFIAQAVEVQGTVIALEESRSSDSYVYHPVVAFVDRQGTAREFRSSVGSNPPSYAEGEGVEVLYLPSDPQTARIHGTSSLWLGSIVLGGLGAVFFLIGAICFYVVHANARKRASLMKHGRRVEAQVQDVIVNESLSANGRSPFQIVTQWLDPETGLLHIFKSENIWFDPSTYIETEKIGVFVDRANPKRYVVDTSFLPKLA